MSLRIFSYLVAPTRTSGATPDISGTEVTSGPLFNMLRADIFDMSSRECDVPIYFTRGPDGKQSNQVRARVIAHLKAPSYATGLTLAEHLSKVSSNKSGLGLLFLINSNSGSAHELVISRFPADRGVLAEPGTSRLEIEYVEKVFMKNNRAYKAARYTGTSLGKSSFWRGRVIDKQLGEPAAYWIYDFLASDLQLTSRAGTRAFAAAVKAATQEKHPAHVKAEIASMATLLRTPPAVPTSAVEILRQYGLSEAATDAVLKHLPNPETAAATFRIDKEELLQLLPYVSAEFATGVVVLGPSESFDKDVQKRRVGDANEWEYTTRGVLTDEKFRGRP